MNKPAKKGFTLIELMVVILIIAILGAIGLVSFSEANKSARDAKRKTDIESTKQALLLYKQENAGYPSSGTFSTVADALVTAGLLTSRPTEPKASWPAYNRSGSGTTSFCICADLEGTTGNATANDCSGIATTTNGSFYCAKQ